MEEYKETNEELLFKSVSLKPKDTFVTESGLDAFKVVSGQISVYIAWIQDGEDYFGRRILLSTISEGDNVPGLNFEDVDDKVGSIRWCFILKAATGVAEIKALYSLGTSVTQRRFIRSVSDYSALKGVGQSFAEHYEKEGRVFERAAKEYYQEEEVKEIAFILKGRKRTVSDINDAGRIIGTVFETDEPVSSEDFCDDPIYRAVYYACRKNGLFVKDYNSIISTCAGKLTVPDIASASQFACRDVVLDQNWYRKDCGTIIGLMGGVPVSCIPKSYGKYILYNGDTQEISNLSAHDAKKINTKKAYVISRTLPSSALKKRDLFKFANKSIRRSDLRTAMVLGLACAIIGVLIPSLNRIIFDDYIPLGNEKLLAQICAVIASFMIGSFFLEIVKNLSNYRISSHIIYDLQNAMYFRAFKLPQSFFHQFDSADLGQRLEYISVIAGKHADAFIVSGLAAVFSLVFLINMFRYSAKLTWFAILMLLVYSALTAGISILTINYSRQAEENRGKACARLYQFLSGVEKIRMAGSEDKAANEYLIPFAAQQNIELKRDRLVGFAGMLSGSVSTIFSMVFYLIIVKSSIKITTGSFIAFTSAFGAFSGVMLTTIRTFLDIYELKPLFDRIRNMIETAHEDDGDGFVIEKGSKGRISIKDLVFSYDGSDDILKGINLEIDQGEYVGIVGESGCGKSTLLKLLLGFELPRKGSIRFDGKDLKTLDKKSFRRNLGVVLQDGKLIAGTIYENITLTAPGASLTDVNRVVKAVDLKEDIDQMPMGLRTVLNENTGTISGGQKQRILIARAIISDPSVLIFDEATSALDNKTQAEVCKSLEKMNITRITVAHRLSTIQNCDRIIVLDKGIIAEEGTYEELMNKHGKFYALAERQIS